MSTQETPAASSALLLAANDRLHALRRALGTSGAWPEARDMHAAAGAAAGAARRREAEPISALPAHLGWENERLAEHLRRHIRDAQNLNDASPAARRAIAGESTAQTQPRSGAPSDQLGTAEPSAAVEQTVRHYPDLGLAMLRAGQAAAGRVWLLLRYIDITGQGWVTVGEATRLLTTEDRSAVKSDHQRSSTASDDCSSPSLRICGRRQFRKLLAAGEGLFWERATSRDGQERLWLRGPARVAAALGLRRLSAAPVALPLPALLGGIGDVRAHLYAAFHSGRRVNHSPRTTAGDALGVRRPSTAGQTRRHSPISRKSLADLTAACANSQRAYERRAGVDARGNVALGPLKTAVDPQAWAWERGRSLFTVIDHDGRHGRPGAAYLAWRLPNDYTGPHARLSRGRLKRINRRIAGLLTNGMTGNVNPASDARGRDSQRYYEDGKSAASARQAGERYWRTGDAGTWHWWPEDSGRWPADGSRRSQAAIGQPPRVISPRLLDTDH